MADLDGEAGDQPMTDDQRAEWNLLGAQLDEFTRRADAMREILAGRGSGDLEAGVHYRSRPASDGRGPLDDALRTVERHANVMEPAAQDRLDRYVRNDRMGLDAQYLAAVGSDAYARAWGRIMEDPVRGHMRCSADEVAAIQEVGRVEQLRALSVGTTTAGGFAVPFALDPTVILTNAGAQNPIRQVARVETINTDTWKGVSSAGVTAAFAAEAAEVADGSPTLAQPTVSTEKAQAFVPFSIEIGMDWPNFSQEIARLIQDGKDNLESTAFATGTGTNEPLGLVVGAVSGGTSVVTGAGTAAFAIADVYSVKQALPARFVPNASFLAHPTVLDTAYRFVGGNSAEPALLPERGGPLLGKPTYEWTSLSSQVTTTGAHVLVYGDAKVGYGIFDRIGLSLEIIPHLMGASGRPTGQRGAYAYWRVGAGTLTTAAFRVLKLR